MENLDRDLPALGVEGAEQGGVAAASDGRDHRVAITQRLAHTLDEVARGHGKEYTARKRRRLPKEPPTLRVEVTCVTQGTTAVSNTRTSTPLRRNVLKGASVPFVCTTGQASFPKLGTL